MIRMAFLLTADSCPLTGANRNFGLFLERLSYSSVGTFAEACSVGWREGADGTREVTGGAERIDIASGGVVSAASSGESEGECRAASTEGRRENSKEESSETTAGYDSASKEPNVRRGSAAVSWAGSADGGSRLDSGSA